MIVFSLFYEKLYYLLGWELDPGSTHMGTQASIFFQKSLRSDSYSWENLRVDSQPGSPQMPYMVILNLRIRLKTKMKTRSCCENLPTLVLTTDLDHWFHQIKN